MAENPKITIFSFGYKDSAAPDSNFVCDVRFLKNPYWEEKLRPLTGMDAAVQEYVLSQPAAVDFLEVLLPFLKSYIASLQKSESSETKIAFGCTGGQHRSVAIAESVSKSLKKAMPDAVIAVSHKNPQVGK